MNEEWFEVNTYWGWFRLDRGAYQDYLKGKLWITWVPPGAKKSQITNAVVSSLPTDLSDEAVTLRNRAARLEKIYPLLQERFHGAEVSIPYKARMSDMQIDEMTLTYRSSNALMRAGINSFGKLASLMQGKGLRSIRNLGAISETEISRKFIDACYMRLTPAEQGRYWQDLIAGDLSSK